MTWLFALGLFAYALSAAFGAYADNRSAVLSLVAEVLFVTMGVAGLRGLHLNVRTPFGPPGFSLHWVSAPLGALFLILVSVLGAAATIYAIAYAKHLPPNKRRTILVFAPLFLASMTLVCYAANMASFLVVWEAMSLTSYALVIVDREEPGVLRSGYVYLLMTHIGALCLLAAFTLLSNHTGSMAFAVWAAKAPSLPSGIRSAVFLLALLGFGSKAALVPLHVWLPRAHPVAPSHISGLMSGVMLKLAIYGMVLVWFVVLGPGPLWWGLVVMALGVLSSVLGVLYALAEHDLKRLLAFHSVENIGIITIGLGVALIGWHAHLPLVSIVALAAALYHTVNHALFKTTLFLDAGSIQRAGAGRNLDALGGLWRRMPWTSTSTLVAATAIAGLPPLNGFVSEWLTYEALLRLGAGGGLVLALSAAIGVLALALTGGLATACFVKVSGIGLLGQPRTHRAAEVHEVSWFMVGPALALAGLCVILGLAPGLIAPILAHIAGATFHGIGLLGSTNAVLVSLPWQGAHLDPASTALFAVLSGAVLSLVLGASRARRPAPEVRAPWACGGAITSVHQYSATAYAKPFRPIFRLVYRPVRSVHVESRIHPFFRTRVSYEGGTTDVLSRWIYRPTITGIVALSRQGRKLQSGSLRLYLALMLATLLLLLAFVH